MQTPWRRYWPLLAIFFLLGAELFVTSPLLSTIASDLKVSTSQAAWLTTSFTLAYAVSTPILATLTDSQPRRRMIIVGAVIFGLGDMAIGLCGQLLPAVIAHAVAGLGAAIAMPTIWAYLGETAAPAQRGRVISSGSTGYSSGQVVGVPLGVFVAVNNWRVAFIIVGALTISVATWVYRAMPQEERDIDHSLSWGRKFTQMLSLWRDRVFMASVVTTACVQGTRVGAYTFIGVIFTHRFAMTPHMLGIIGGLVGVGAFVGSVVAGQLIDRWRFQGHRMPSLSAVWICGLLIGLALALAVPNVGVALAGLMLWSASGAAYISTAQGQLSHDHPRTRSVAASWNNASMYAGIAMVTATLGSFHIPGLSFVLVALAFPTIGLVLMLLARLIYPREVPTMFT